jgi:hypothetical protein
LQCVGRTNFHRQRNVTVHREGNSVLFRRQIRVLQILIVLGLREIP